MHSLFHRRRRGPGSGGVAGLVLVAGLLAACAVEAPSKLPPNASDLVLLKTGKLCDQKPAVLGRLAGAPIKRDMWGTGEEIRIPADRSATKAEESFFFDQDDQLVGALFIFPRGLSLEPYPTLQETLGKLKPSFEFYLNVAQVSGQDNMDPSVMFETGDASSTTRYLLLSGVEPPTLLAASFSIDPYAKLISPYRAEFLARIERGEKVKSPPRVSKGSVDKEPFAALQQFARGEAAHFGSCGTKDDTRAADAYGKASKVGFSDKAWQAEVSHKLGLAYLATGQLEPAKASIQQALTIRPNTAEFLNSLGTVYAAMGNRQQAVASFERAVTLRPNYVMARYNLAEAYETVNPRRAIDEYETYLALVEGDEDEKPRADRARLRVQRLKR